MRRGSGREKGSSEARRKRGERRRIGMGVIDVDPELREYLEAMEQRIQTRFDAQGAETTRLEAKLDAWAARIQADMKAMKQELTEAIRQRQMDEDVAFMTF